MGLPVPYLPVLIYPSSYMVQREVPFYTMAVIFLLMHQPKMHNPDLKWEKKAEFDVGLDFVLFNNRLTGSFDYYNRNTSDLLFNATVPVPPILLTRNG